MQSNWVQIPEACATPEEQETRNDQLLLRHLCTLANEIGEGIYLLRSTFAHDQERSMRRLRVNGGLRYYELVFEEPGKYAAFRYRIEDPLSISIHDHFIHINKEALV